MKPRPHPTAKGSATARPGPASVPKATPAAPPPGVTGPLTAGGRGDSTGHEISLGAEDSGKVFPFPVAASAQGLGELLGVTARRIRQLAEDGHVTRTGRGLFPVRETVCAYLRIVSETPGSHDESRLLAARAARMEYLAKVAKFQAQEAKRRSELLSGKAIDVDLARPALVEMIGICRMAILAIPSKLAAQLADLSSPATVETMLRDAIYEALSNLSNPGSKFFAAMAAKYRANEKRELATDREGQPTTESDDFSDL